MSGRRRARKRERLQATVAAASHHEGAALVLLRAWQQPAASSFPRTGPKLTRASCVSSPFCGIRFATAAWRLKLPSCMLLVASFSWPFRAFVGIRPPCKAAASKKTELEPALAPSLLQSEWCAVVPGRLRRKRAVPSQPWVSGVAHMLRIAG